MGFESRNGNLYYYRKVRIGDRVVSKYEGSGALAEFADFHARRERKERELRARAERELEERQLAAFTSLAEIDSRLDWIDNRVELLARAALLQAGYHQHKRQWRKRRDAKKQKD